MSERNFIKAAQLLVQSKSAASSARALRCLLDLVAMQLPFGVYSTTMRGTSAAIVQEALGFADKIVAREDYIEEQAAKGLNGQEVRFARLPTRLIRTSATLTVCASLCLAYAVQGD